MNRFYEINQSDKLKEMGVKQTKVIGIRLWPELFIYQSVGIKK